MSRVTSRSRETTTRPRWVDSGRDVRPRVLDELEYAAAVTSQSGVDGDGNQYLFFTVPSSRYCPSPAAALAESADGKTRVWRCMDNGQAGSDMSADGSGDRLSTYRDDDRSNTSTSGRVRTEKRLTSTGQSPSSPLSPSSQGLISPVSRRSAIPVRVTTSSTGTPHVASIISFTCSFYFPHIMVQALVKVAWDEGGRRLPTSNIWLIAFPPVRYLNGRTGTVTGMSDTTQKSSITEVECSTMSTVMMSDNKV